MNYKAAVFDLDGTLLDSLEDIATSANEALKKMGYAPHHLADYRYHVGDGLNVLAQRVLPPAHRDLPTAQAFVNEMRTEYAQRWSNTTKPYAGIPELLDELVRRGFKLAVLSNKPHDFTQVVTATLLPKWTFNPMIGARVGIPHKPDPAGAVEIAELLKLPAAECIFLGDTYADMRAATGAGMFPVGVLWGFRPAQELLESGAKLLIKDPLELLKAL